MTNLVRKYAALGAAALCTLFPALLGQSTKPAKEAAQPAGDADAAWEEVLRVSRQPSPPKEWNQNKPSNEDIQKFNETMREFAVKGAEKAREFYTRFPQHANAQRAKDKEHLLLGFAARSGTPEIKERFEKLEAERSKNKTPSPQERFNRRVNEIMAAARAKEKQGEEAYNAELIKGMLELVKEFPEATDVSKQLLMLGARSKPELATQIAEVIAKSEAPEDYRNIAKGTLKRLALVGKPVPIKFKAVDGREVDVEKMKGKVVLVDFWATWCAPCMASLPDLKNLYQTFHAKGLEIIGINSDYEKKDLTRFLSRDKLAWPQHYEGDEAPPGYGAEYGIMTIPTMWLIDKQGKLRDLDAHPDLESKIAKLLAE